MRNISCSYHAICGTLPYCSCHSRECTASHLPISLFEQQVPQLLWVATVAVIFGVSYVSLQGLQGPLASLDMSAHVLYRCAHACSAQQPRLLQLCCMAGRQHCGTCQSLGCTAHPLHAATAHPCTFHTHPHPKRGLPARMSRCRLTSNALAFSTVAGENAVHRAELLEELSLLREAYSTLLYGGYMRLQVLHTKDSIA